MLWQNITRSWTGIIPRFLNVWKKPLNYDPKLAASSSAFGEEMSHSDWISQILLNENSAWMRRHVVVQMKYLQKDKTYVNE